MTDVQQNTVAPGWYTDPAGSPQLRWWSGTAWTHHLADPPRSIPEPNIPTAVAPLSPTQRAEYVPFSRNWAQEETDAHLDATKRNTQTLPSWLLAVAPFWAGAAAALGRVITASWDPIVSAGAGVVVAWGLMFGLAFLDGRRLQSRGFSTATSPAWVLLFSPIFFIIRTVRVGVGGLAPLLVNVAFWVVLFAAAFLVLPTTATNYTPSTVTAPAPAATTAPGDLSPAQRSAELSPKGLPVVLRADLTQSGHTVTKVTCVPFPNTKANTTTTCDVTMDGKPAATLRLRVSPEQPKTAFTLLEETPGQDT